MLNLIAITKMTSMEIAEITNKEHFHVIRDIRDEIEKLSNAGINTETKFGLRERDGITGTIPYYELSQEGVLQLAARYDAVVRAKLIEKVTKQEPMTPQLLIASALIEAQKMLDSQNKQINSLQTENKMLAGQTLTWADRKILEAIVKAYGASINIPEINGFQEAWRDFKKELLYRHSINLNSRLTAKINETGKKNIKTLDMIHDDELPKCISTAVALCKSHKIDISEILGKYKN